MKDLAVPHWSKVGHLQPIKPHHRVEEHLITAKALISRSMFSEGGCIIQLVDIKGFFDAESLRGVVGSLYTAKIPMKAYRMWCKQIVKL